MVAKVVVFDQIRNTPKPYYSPDIYCNVNEPIIIRPRKKIVVVFCNSSKYDRQTDQYQLLFSKGHYLYKMNYYKFCIVITNKSFKSKLICNTNCSLTKLLSHSFVHHEMCHIKPSYLKHAEMYCRNKCQTQTMSF
jgi:hypothetical protein